MRRLRILVKRVLLTGKKFIRYFGKRFFSLLCITAILFSLVSAGVLVSKEKEAKAIAGVDDYTFFVEVMKIISSLACASGGASNSDLFTSADEAGITSWADAKGYVHSSMSGNPSFQRFLDSVDINTKSIQRMELTLAAGFFMGGFVMQQKFLNKLFDYDNDRSNWDYDPARDGYDKDKYGQLTDDQKEQVFLDQATEDLLEALKNTPTLMFPPDPDYDFNDDDDDDTIREKLKNKFNDKGEPLDAEGNPIVIDSSVVASAFGTSLYTLMYTLTKHANREDARSRLAYAEPEEEAADVFNYNFQDWESSPNIMYFEDAAFAPSLTTLQNFSIRFSEAFFSPTWNNSYSSYSESHLYPCLYWEGDSPYLALTSDKPLAYSSNAVELHRKSGGGSGGGYVHISPDAKGQTRWSLDQHMPWQSQFDNNYDLNELHYLIQNRQKVDGYVKVCEAPYLIDCDTKDNFDRFSELIQTKDYTLDQLLDCMKDGWKSLPKKSWKAVDDKGETTKKVMATEKGKKYKKKGTKVSKKEDGTTVTEKDQEGVNHSSLVSGMQSGEFGTSPKTSIDELLGEQTTKPDPYPYPKPETKPDPDPSPDPGTGGGTDDPDPPSPTPTPTPEPGALPSVPGTDSDIQWYERFPFCIPWDIYDGVSALKANTKVPKWRIPFEIKRLGIKEGVTIDFSEYETLRTICNWFLRILFALGLVMISRPIIKG